MSYQPFPSFADWGAQFDASVVEQYAERLRQAKEAASPEAQQKALEIATRYAAVDTGALEGLYTTDRGFTRTIATQSEFWQRAIDLKGEQTKRSIQDALNAYDYVLDAVAEAVPITEKWIRELHAVITEHQESFAVVVSVADQVNQEQRPLPHGEYKHLPNNPINRDTGRLHYYASPEETPAEMARFIDELRSEEFLGAHPVVQAAYAHYAYIRIHPFRDGNGRVSRALASVYLYRNPGVPLVIFADQRDTYIDVLEAADEGRPGPFVQFITQRVIDSVNMITQSMAVRIDTTSVVAEINSTLDAGLDEGLLLSAGRLHQLCYSQFESAIQNLKMSSRMKVWPSVGGASGSVVLPDGYVLPGLGNDGIYLCAQTADQALVTATLHCCLAVTTEADHPEMLVIPDSTTVPSLEVWQREIDPTVSASLEARLTVWATNVVGVFIGEVCRVLKGKRLS